MVTAATTWRLSHMYRCNVVALVIYGAAILSKSPKRKSMICLELVSEVEESPAEGTILGWLDHMVESVGYPKQGVAWHRGGIFR